LYSHFTLRAPFQKNVSCAFAFDICLEYGRVFMSYEEL
jgi:hypothetical protein